MPDRATINQKVQLGVESTPGTAVAANKLLQCFDWQFGIDADVMFYRATGRKYESVQEENTEWTSGTAGGPLDYNAIIYLLSGAMGSTSPVAHGSSSTAKDWIYTPPVTGNASPKTYTAQQGDSVRAHQVAYLLFNEFGYKGTRKDFTVSAKWMAQPLSDGITLTASPTAVALAPAPSKHFNIYLDTTSGALGTTQLTRVLSVDYSMSNIYGPLWVFNRANLGWGVHIDTPPKAIFKLKMEADSTGMAQLPNLQSGATVYVRLNATGLQIASDGPGAVNNVFQHDMALKVGKPTAFADDQGVFAIEWEMTVVEDSGWNSGQAQTLTVTNLITAL